MDVKGLDAQRVARQNQFAGLMIPHRNGEHAFQPGPDRLPPSGVALENDFGVAVTVEVMTEGPQLPAQFLEIINLTVEDNAIAAVGGAHGLVAAGDIDHGQPPHAETEIAIAQHPFIIRATMPDSGAHGPDDLGRCGAPIPAIPAGDAAHGQRPLDAKRAMARRYTLTTRGAIASRPRS